MRDRDVKPGDPISKFTAEAYRAIVAEIESWEAVKGAWPIIVDDGTSGKRIRIDHTQGFYATLSGSTSPYSFTEKYGTSGGTWTSGVRTGTTNAYEVNSTASLNGKTVWVEPGFPGDYRFQYVNSSGGGAPTGSMPGCTCSTPPATLYMTVSGTCDPDLYNNCTIQYGATPPLLVGALGANGYFSTTTFTESSSGDLFYINLFCTGSTMSIRRVFESATSFGGAPYVDTVFFFWTVGFPGNTCSPFLLSAGDDGSGSPPCLVTISE